MIRTRKASRTRPWPTAPPSSPSTGSGPTAQSGCLGGPGRLEEEEEGGGGGGGKSEVHMSLIRRKKTITNDVFVFSYFCWSPLATVQ